MKPLASIGVADHEQRRPSAFIRRPTLVDSCTTTKGVFLATHRAGRGSFHR